MSALTAWARDGVPERPGAWLTTAARRTALNALARGRTLETKLPLLLEPDAAEPRRRRRRDPRRPPAARLHLLPPGARARGAGRADAAAGVRRDDRRDRPRVPGERADDGRADHPREEEDRRRGHPVRRPDRPRAAPGRGAGRRAPARHDRPHRAVGRAARPRRPRRARARPRADAAAAAARRARGRRPARAAAAAARPRRDAATDVLEDQDRSLWDRGADRRGRRADRRPRCGPARRGASRSRPRSRACTPRRRATRRPTGRSCSCSTTCCSASGRRRWSRSTARWSWPRCAAPRRPWRRSRRSTASTATATCWRPRPTCCAASAATRRRARPTARRCALTDNATERAFLEAALTRA